MSRVQIPHLFYMNQGFHTPLNAKYNQNVLKMIKCSLIKLCNTKFKGKDLFFNRDTFTNYENYYYLITDFTHNPVFLKLLLFQIHQS